MLVGWSRSRSFAAAVWRVAGVLGGAVSAARALGVLWAKAWAAHEPRRDAIRLSTIVDDCDVAIVVVEQSGRVAVWNTAMARLTGTAAGHAVGRHVIDLFTLTRDDGAAADLKEMRCGTVRMRTRTGRSLWVQISVSHSAAPDGGGLFTAVLTDTSATRHLDSTRHLLLVSAHHELHSPLTVISGHAQLLSGAVTEQGTRESVEAIHDAVEMMQHVIRDLGTVVLDTAPSSGRPVTTSETIDVSRLLRRALQNIPSVAGRSSLSVLCKVAMRGDPVRLRQCLLLVLDNADKYAPRGTVSISVRAQGDHGVISIADEGPGLADAELQQALTPYYRSAKTRNLPGAGLGLHIAHTMMTAMRGGIELIHAPTGGLQVNLWLPLTNPRACRAVPVKVETCHSPC
ncbi:PAS domain-containing sensor histidine kinase [Actinomadura montaniterrae]|nr:PAS domain-containing sensor histidine kinase [Actinomadura montaniterrae]